MARLLVVDDNDANLELIHRRLKRQNHEVDIANDGIQALEFLNSNQYQLILLDIEMPKLNGIDTLKHIKSSPDLANNTVIMLTGHNDIGHLKECLQLGAADYITKPIDMPALNRRIEELT